MAYQPPSVKIHVEYPHAAGQPADANEPSLFDVTVTGPSVLNPSGTGTIYDGWCLDETKTINSPGDYTGRLFSSYELALLQGEADFAGSAFVQNANIVNLDNINWLLNFYTGLASGYTWGEMQGAIWQLIGQSTPDKDLPFLGAYDAAKVTTLTNLALTNGEGFVPTAGQAIGVILDTVDVPSGQHFQPLLIETKAAALGDFVWNDINANGFQDLGEIGISGVKVNLVRDLDNNGVIGAGEVLATTTTDSAGHYTFNGLTPGLSYQVQFVQPTGFSGVSIRQADGSSTSGTNSDGLLSDVVVLAPGENNTTLDAGFYKPVVTASLGDRLWIDANGNGKQDSGEVGISGQTVTLISGGADGLISTTGDNVTTTTTTGADGIYAFTGLTPGQQYQVQFVAPAGTLFTAANVSANGFDAVDSDADKTTGKTQVVTLAAGENNTTIDAGVYTAAQLSGYVYQDAGNDGIRNSEPAIAGVVLTLTGTDGAGNAVTATTTTNASGFYAFTNLAPGSYTVSEAQPAAYADGKDTVGSTGGSNAVNDVLSSITLISGANSVENNFGELVKAHIGDFVWEDKNANGVQDAGEAGVGGVTVKLLNTAGTVVGTTTTNAAGGYGFDVAPGTYSVQVTAPSGYVITGKDLGGNDAADSDIDSTGKTGSYVLNSGDNNLTVDAGLYKLAQLGDRVWYDTNANGVQDSGEAGAAGVTVNLLNAAGSIVGTQTTTSTGGYLFTGLVPGSYSVQFVAPNGYAFTVKDASSNTLDSTDSDSDTSTGKTGSYTLNSGDSNLTVDAGLVAAKAHLGDFVWNDLNANGVQDVGETGIAGVTVSLKNSAGTVVATTTTDAAGKYGFDVAPGTYSVQFTNPTGYVVTTKDASGNSLDTTDSDISTTGATGSYTLVNGDNNLSIDAGYYKLASLGDRIWYDKNANGLQDAGEAGVAGVKLDLYNNTTGAIVGTATTDASGNYLFSSLTPGSYHVDVQEATLPSGFIFTKANQGGNDAVDSDVETLGATVPLIWGIMANTTLTSGENDLTWDAGVYKVGIDVQKLVHGEYTVQSGGGGTEGLTPGFWKNHTGQGAAPLSGWPETGYAPSNSYETIFGVNVPGSAPTLLQALSTGGGGVDALLRHSAAALLNASDAYIDFLYSTAQVIAMVQAAFLSGDYETTKNLFATQNQLEADLTNLGTKTTTTVITADVDADTAGTAAVIPVGATAVFTYVVNNTGDAALKNVVLTDDRIGSVSYVSGDTNNNGLLDTTETWTYKASEVAAAGTIKNTGTVTATDSVGGVASVTANDPAYYTGTTATKGSLGDRVWLDSNNNGIQDNGETGIGGIKVTLKGAGKDGIFGTADDTTATTTTASNGAYLFGNLDAGKYQAVFSNTTGYLVTKQNQGSNDAADSDIDSTGATAVVTLGAGEQNLTVDAGLYMKASVGDKVFEDKNHNNLQDTGEAGIGGITVKLLSSSGAVLATTLTNSSGNYLFSNLDPGAYTLQFDKTNVTYNSYNMSTWKWAAKDVGSNDAIDSDVNGDAIATTNVTVTSQFSLTSGQNDMTKDAGITPIVINLDGNGIHTISRADSTGTFDLFGTGHGVSSGWIANGSGFLAVDKNGNGQIDDINELFGGNAKGAGFSQLASYDSNGDGLVDAKDADFDKLLIWQDLNGDHKTNAGELMTLAQAGIASLTVAYTELPFIDAQGNLHLERSSATLSSGNSVSMTDVYFNVSADDAKAAGVALPSMADLLGSTTLDTVVGAGTASTLSPVGTEPVCDTAGDAGEALRRIAMLTREEGHHTAA